MEYSKFEKKTKKNINNIELIDQLFINKLHNILYCKDGSRGLIQCVIAAIECKGKPMSHHTAIVISISSLRI